MQGRSRAARRHEGALPTGHNKLLKSTRPKREKHQTHQSAAQRIANLVDHDAPGYLLLRTKVLANSFWSVDPDRKDSAALSRELATLGTRVFVLRQRVHVLRSD